MSKLNITRKIISDIREANIKGLTTDDLEAAKVGLIADIALSLSEIVDYLRKRESDEGREAE